MLEVVPCTISDAQSYVEQHHRHHGKARSHLFACALSDGEKIRGVAIVGRPVARMLQDGWTAEVVRLATDGVALRTVDNSAAADGAKHVTVLDYQPWPD